MTEERRAEPAMDATAKAGGAAAGVEGAEEQLDEAELEEVPVAKVPPVRRSAASQPPPDAVSSVTPSAPPSRVGARDSSSGGARRTTGRRGIRIPDDEISRPTPAVASGSIPPAAPPALDTQVSLTSHSHSSSPPPVEAIASEVPAVAMQPMQPMRIISIDASPSPSRLIADADSTQEVAVPAIARGVPAPGTKGGEDSWTPYQPTVADESPAEHARSGTQPIASPAARDDGPARPSASSEELIPISSDTDLEPVNGPESGEPLELDDAESHALLSSRPPPPRTPPPPRPVSGPPPPTRATAPTEPEGEEVRFEDDEPTPIAGRVEGVDRVSEPGETAEISAEDMVSVESVPAPRAQPTSGLNRQLSVPTPPVAYAPPPMRPRAASVPPPVPGAVASLPTPTGATPRPPLVIVPPHVGVAAPNMDISARRKARPWWEDLFNDDYIRTMAKVTDSQISAEADFIEDSLGVAKGGTMLDLGCGTGAHAIELARRGYEVVGFDLSLSMLARAADDAQASEQKLNFVQGDMREMTFEDAFDGVFCWNTSFGFFDEETNAKVIGKVYKALKKGGQLVLDVANRDFVAKQAPSLAWFEGDGCVCMDEMQIDWITSRMRVKRTLMMDDGRSKEIEYSVRLYALHELGRILHEQGFRVAEVSGRTATPGVFFGAESPRTLILAEKR